MTEPELSIVIPVYDEEESIGELSSRLTAVMDALATTVEVIFVDDRSRDRTYPLLEELSRRDPRFKVLRLSRNFGHQLAITAGLEYASGQAVVLMDGDLQDPPEVIPQLVERWRDGFEVVYAVREARQGESWPKRLFASVFYRVLGKMSDVEIPVDVGDFRLVDRRVVEIFKGMREHNPYLRGLFSWIGFRQTGVPYRRDERHAGRSKYPLAKSLKLGLDAIVGFSQLPLRAALAVGFVVSTLGLIAGAAAVVAKLSGAYVVPGWASLVVVVSVLGGIQLAVLGAVGLYVGRIYDDVKDRPRYVVDELRGFGPEAPREITAAAGRDDGRRRAGIEETKQASERA